MSSTAPQNTGTSCCDVDFVPDVRHNSAQIAADIASHMEIDVRSGGRQRMDEGRYNGNDGFLLPLLHQRCVGECWEQNSSGPVSSRQQDIESSCCQE
jgi:hypothetical protein